MRSPRRTSARAATPMLKGLAPPRVPRGLAREVVLGGIVFAAGCAGAKSSSAPADDVREKHDTAFRAAFGAEAVRQGGLRVFGGKGSEPAGAAAAHAFLPNRLRLDRLASDAKITLDGIPNEWPEFTRARQTLSGRATEAALAVGLQYDDENVYVAGVVDDRSFVRSEAFAIGEDHVTLDLVFPGQAPTSYEVLLFAGKPGESEGAVKVQSRAGTRTLPSGAIVEAEREGGYSFEARVPWSAMPESRSVRVGLTGRARYHDAGPSGRTAELSTSAGLLLIPTAPEISLLEGLVLPKGLEEGSALELYADVTGDASLEKVAVWGRWLTVVGHAYRGGDEYYFRELRADAVRLERRPLVGRGKDDLVIRTRARDGDIQRESVEVASFLGGDEAVPVFAHEVAVESASGKIRNSLRFEVGQIEVTSEPALGWDRTTYGVSPAAWGDPILLPWASARRETYRFDGSRFVRPEGAASPVEGASAVSSALSPAPRPAGPGGTSTGALLDRYKSDRGLAQDVRPRFEFSADLDGDSRAERVLLFERDLVIVGPAIGTGEYLFVTMAQFEAADKITSVTSRDVTGEGAADVIVRGFRSVTPPDGKEAVRSEMLFTYAFVSGRLERVFGAETARQQGARRVETDVRWGRAAGSGAGPGYVELRPGTVRGYVQANYPWPEEPPGGSLEPLVLPWSGTSALRYTWDGRRFAR